MYPSEGVVSYRRFAAAIGLHARSAARVSRIILYYRNRIRRVLVCVGVGSSYVHKYRTYIYNMCVARRCCVIMGIYYYYTLIAVSLVAVDDDDDLSSGICMVSGERARATVVPTTTTTNVVHNVLRAGRRRRPAAVVHVQQHCSAARANRERMRKRIYANIPSVRVCVLTVTATSPRPARGYNRYLSRSSAPFPSGPPRVL